RNCVKTLTLRPESLLSTASMSGAPAWAKARAATSSSAAHRIPDCLVEARIRDSVLRSGPVPGDRGQRGIRVGMAGTRAVAQFRDRVTGGRRGDLGVRLALVVVCMTAGAGIGVRRRAPRHCVGVGGMAAGASQAHT